VHLGLSGPLAHDADLTSTAQPSIPTPSVPARILILAQRLTNATLALWMPYLWFTGALLALLFAFVRPRASHERRAWASLLLFAAATAYYAGFLVLSPAFEWRYFLPSFVLLPIVIVAALRAALSPATKSMPPPSRRTIAP
jgi:hypothetical protein